MVPITDYVRFSSNDAAKSGLGSKRILNVEGGFLSAPPDFLVQRLQNSDSKDLGLKGLSMNDGRMTVVYTCFEAMFLLFEKKRKKHCFPAIHSL